jgi:hypothetical protein
LGSVTLRGGRALLALLAPIALLPLVLAVGCASAPGPRAKEPPPLASLLAVHSPTPSPTPDTSAVQTAVKAYVTGVNVALRTGDTKQAQKLTTSACTCRKELKKIADVYASKGHFVGARIDVASLTAGTVTKTTAQATLTYNSPPSKVVNRKGKSKSIAPAANQQWAVTLVKSSGAWLVSSVKTVKK